MVSACLRLTPWGFFLAAAAPAREPAGVAGIGVVGVLGIVVAGVAGVAGKSASADGGSLVLEVIDIERTGRVAFLALEAGVTAEAELAGV